ncbi:hypothetical protein D3C81_1829430 [compost metagenome]
MMAWLTEIMPPAPIPWMMRASTSCSMLWAMAHRAEARVNRPMPNSIILRRPYKSPSLP